jgi:hypothetical protein
MPIDFPNADFPIQSAYHQFSTNSFIDMAGLSNSPVYYQKVTESFGDNYEGGGIEHDFQYNQYLPISTVLGTPILSAVAPQLDWRNGLELATKQFKLGTGGTQLPVESKYMNYQIDLRNSSTLNQYSIEKIGNMDPGLSNPAFSVPLNVQIQNYSVAQIGYLSEWQYLAFDSVQQFDINNNPSIAIKQIIFMTMLLTSVNKSADHR